MPSDVTNVWRTSDTHRKATGSPFTPPQGLVTDVTRIVMHVFVATRHNQQGPGLACSVLFCPAAAPDLSCSIPQINKRVKTTHVNGLRILRRPLSPGSSSRSSLTLSRRKTRATIVHEARRRTRHSMPALARPARRCHPRRQQRPSAPSTD